MAQPKGDSASDAAAGRPPALESREITIVEVGPRDGLQNERVPVSVADRVALILDLARAGCRVIEAGAFVSPKWVPQMAASEAVLAATSALAGEGIRRPVLVPNAVGLARAREAGADEVAVFAAASETFSQRNTNCSIAEGLERARTVAADALAAGLRVRGYVSCVVACPYEGAVDPGRVAAVVSALVDMGCFEVSLGDTIGVATAGEIRALLRRLRAEGGGLPLALHCHDTYGQAVANIWEGLWGGIRTVDAAVAGLGGCPYAPGATGNVATEDVVWLLDRSGLQTGIDLDLLAAAGRRICSRLGREPVGRVARALAAKAVA